MIIQLTKESPVYNSLPLSTFWSPQGLSPAYLNIYKVRGECVCSNAKMDECVCVCACNSSPGRSKCQHPSQYHGTKSPQPSVQSEPVTVVDLFFSLCTRRSLSQNVFLFISPSPTPLSDIWLASKITSV